MAAKSTGFILKALLIILMVISICPLLPVAQAKAATILVPEDYETIQAAVAEAHSGDIISVAGGGPPYIEQVLVTKNLTIIGRDAENPPEVRADPARSGMIPGPGGSDYIIGGVGCNLRLENLYINANGATGPIDGAANVGGVVMSGVTGTGAGVYNCDVVGFAGNTGDPTYCIIIANTSTLAIDGCSLQGYQANGINAAGSGPGNNVTVHNCLIWGSAGANSGQYGIWINGGTATVDDCSITIGQTGIFSTNANITISNNRIYGQQDEGIRISKGGTVAIHDNDMNTIGSQGIKNTDVVDTGTIYNNEIYDCTTAISLEETASNWSLTNNLLYSCTSCGVRSNCALPVFSQNIIYNCTIGIRMTSDLLTAHCNAIMANTTAGLELHDNGAFNVTNNYWGANSGPNVDNAGPGTGDKITTNSYTVLTYNPWAQMYLSGTPASIVADGSATSTITLDCTRNSAGNTMGCNIPDGVPVAFVTTLGTLTSNWALTSGGRAVTTLISGDTPGTADLTSFFYGVESDPLRSTGQVIFTAPPPPPPPVQPFVNTGGPTSHGASVPSVPTSQGAVQLSNVQVTSARLSTSHTNPGSPVTVTANVSNTGGAGGATMLKVYLDGEPAGSKGVNVAAGSTTPVTLTITPEREGAFAVSVNGVQAGSLDVSGAPDNDLPFIISFASFAVLIIALTAIYLRKRRTMA